jgi:phosphoglycolate phosphatase-like HAD superfamily hydrolase
MKPKAVIFDMDGTLVDVSGIRHHIFTPGQKNFDAFHNDAVNCPPHEWVKWQAESYDSDGYHIIQVTARSEKYRPSTSWWLAENQVPSHALYMRPDKDYRPDTEVKREIIDRILKRYTIVHAFDDNPAIVKLWGEYAIPCTVVPGWET